jgi:sulfoxide reductase heme-binding subunit YedZ
MPVRARFSGWPLTGWCALLLLAVAAAVLGALGTGEEGTRAMIRTTAQISLALFSTAFAASALYTRRPGGTVVKWIRANRRYLGVSFALSHTLHLVFLIRLGQVSREFVEHLSLVVLIAGGLGYVFLFAMAATSFDRTAAWLGPRRWRLLHGVGMYYLWLVFFQSYAPRAAASPGYAPFALLLVAVLGLRLWAALRRRGRKSLAPSGAAG